MPAPPPTMGPSEAGPAFGVDAIRPDGQPRMFKKHKVLPHPTRHGPAAYPDRQRSVSARHNVYVEAPLSTRRIASTGSKRSAPSDAHQQLSPPRPAARGPEPPPTPPTHSRTSSSSQPTDPSSSSHALESPRISEGAPSRPPVTPPHQVQQSPPTPNLTPDQSPPGPATRQPNKPPRPPIQDRAISKLTVDSRTESFRTAPENPCTSDDDDGRSTLRPILPSTKTSQSTVRQADPDPKPRSRAVGLGLGLESSPEADLTPRTAKEFRKFDGEWTGGETGAVSEVEEEWDDNLGRNVKVKKRRPAPSKEGRGHEVVDDMTVSPTNATKALRSMSLMESPLVYPRRVVSDRVPLQNPPSTSGSSISTDFRRSSIMSTKSTASTVVEAIVEVVPQRRKTLRHVRKQSLLRDSSSEISPPSSAPTSVSAVAEDQRRQPATNTRPGDAPRESLASIATTASISSRKVRREIWMNGGIPVAVVPDRRSSVKGTSREPSLRSTSSRRSQRSPSLGSAPLSHLSKAKDHVPVFECPTRRSRALSESDGSRPGDERTMDFPPAIPARSSSLSAPTSRNASRSGSLTAESLKAHNAFQAQQAHHALQKVHLELEKIRGLEGQSGDVDKARNSEQAGRRRPSLLGAPLEPVQPKVLVHRVSSEDLHKSLVNGSAHSGPLLNGHDMYEQQGERLVVDHHGDPFFGKRLSVQNTPFSVASGDTAGTSHAEVSEAMAVNIYPHQSKSVVLVDHYSTKPSESSSLERYRSSETETPVIRTTDAEGNEAPGTPPQPTFFDHVDSPLRNPRAPPKPPLPPVINFIPATPSGLTPTTEKQRQLGNYYEMTDEKPKRSTSLLRRALTRRRISEHGPSSSRVPGLLTRTFSLSRRRDDQDRRRGLRRVSSVEDRPADESRLHPFWRPAYLESESSDEDDDEEEEWSGRSRGRTYRYPLVDNRPGLPRRSLSARLKRTFAILPVRDDDDYDGFYTSTSQDVPERKTIRRTPSGNLRVMTFRRSMESLPRTPAADSGRPYTAPEQQDGLTGKQVMRMFWRSPSLSRRKSRGGGPRRTLPSGHGGGGGTWAATEEPEKTRFLPTLGDKINIPRRLSERRREKRTDELRRMISGPKEVRDGVGEVIRRGTFREMEQERQQTQTRSQHATWRI